VARFAALARSVIRGNKQLDRRTRRLEAPSVPFDQSWYRSQLPRSFFPCGNLRRHYIRSGARDGLSPHPLFDPNWYLAQLPGPLPEGETAFEHFLREGGPQGYSPHPLFDSRWYLDVNPDVEETGANPLLHFLASGADEGRKPNPSFDPLWYRNHHLTAMQGAPNPLIHYALIGVSQKLAPSEFCDTRNHRSHDHHVDAAAHQRRTPLPLRGPRKLPVKLLIISTNIDTRSWHRASMLANVASRVVRDVTLINLRIDFHQCAPPTDNGLKPSWPAIDIDVKSLPDMLNVIQHIASVATPDIVLTVTSSLPALLLGMRLRERSGCRMILDIDADSASLDGDDAITAQLERLFPTWRSEQADADACSRDQLIDVLIAGADGLITSDTAQQRRFGGFLVPSIHNETSFSPAPNRSPQEAINETLLAAYSSLETATSLHNALSRALAQPASKNMLTTTSFLATLPRTILTPESANPGLLLPGTDIIVFWKQNDTTLYGRRHDMVIKYLASRPDVRKVIVFDLPISVHDLNKFRDAATEQANEYRHIYIRTQKKALELLDTAKISYRSFIHHPQVGKVDGAPSPDGRSNQHVFCDFVASVFDKENIQPDDAIFWVYPRNSFIEPLVEAFRPRRVVVDVVDDHRAWPDVTAEQKTELTEHYRRVLALADFSFANCEPVVRAMKPFSPAIQLIPNGCEIEPEIIEPKASEAFDTFKTWPGEIIGYVGNLEEKIDIQLLHQLAQAFPDCLIALIGSTHANPSTHELARHVNILMPGVVPYDEIGAWISRFSVGIIPHRNMDLTQTMNPLKLFVYAAYGVPVVATDIPNLSREWVGLSVASDHADFLRQTGDRLRTGIKLDKQSSFVLANSWTNRLEKAVSKILSN